MIWNKQHVVSSHRGRFVVATSPFSEITQKDFEKAVNENTEMLEVPEELEELMLTRHYLLDYLERHVEVTQEVIDQKLADGLGREIKIFWQLRDQPKEINVVFAKNTVGFKNLCRCSHERGDHDRGFGECAACEIGVCLEFIREIKTRTAEA
jgi:hypothetical protein